MRITIPAPPVLQQPSAPTTENIPVQTETPNTLVALLEDRTERTEVPIPPVVSDTFTVPDAILRPPVPAFHQEEYTNLDEDDLDEEEIREEPLRMEDVLVPAPVPEVILPVEPVTVEAVAEPNPRVKVTIKKENGTVVITASHRLPSIENIYANMEPTFKRKFRVKGYWGVETHILKFEEIVPFQIWADAISATIMLKLGNEAGVTSELNHMAQGGYLALGGMLYKMSAIASSPQTKALAVTRKKIREGAEAEAKTLVENAKLSAETIVVDATRIRNKAKEYKKEVELSAGRVPPSWMFETGYCFRYGTGYNTGYGWQMQLVINFKLTHYDIKFMMPDGKQARYTWEALPMEPRLIRLWIPVDTAGGYTATGIYVDHDDPEIPHINHNSACMGLASGPKHLATGRDLNKLREALEFTHQRVQLDSLYTPFEVFTKNFPVVPADLAEAWGKGRVDGATTLAKKLNNEIVDHKREEKLTWTA